MFTEPHARIDTVAYEGHALVRLPEVGAAEVEVDLRGGRPRWSVGGQIAEGPRWWRGEVSFPDEDVSISAGTEITVELDNGRTAPAVVEEVVAPVGMAIRGLGPPPFDVP